MTRPVALALALTVFGIVPVAAQDPVKPYSPGPGVKNPIVLHEEEPKYTADGLRARIQGIVEVEAIILPSGLVGDVRIHKSLDKVFGLDLEALAAARRWRFRPAEVDSKAVPFKAIIQLEFRLSKAMTPMPPRLSPDQEFTRGAVSLTTPGLVLPKVKQEEKPKYTSEGLQRKIQGTVELEAVVGIDGRVERARVVKSLDKEFGLDEEALRAARAWTFEPATLNGAPVPVVVVIQLDFRVGR